MMDRVGVRYGRGGEIVCVWSTGNSLGAGGDSDTGVDTL